MTSLSEFGRLRTSKALKPMPRALLESTVAAFLKEVNVCVMATSLNDVPLATPIEYYAKDFTIYMASGQTTKVTNLKANPRISIGIYSPVFADWEKWHEVKGAQIFGRADILRPAERPEAYAAAMEVYEWRHYRKAMGLPLDRAPESIMIKVPADVISYRDLGLMRQGWAPVQVWKRQG